MKRTLSLSIVPFVLALGACSSSSNNNNNNNSSSVTRGDSGAAGDAGHPLADGGGAQGSGDGGDATVEAGSEAGASGSTDDGGGDQSDASDDGSTTTTYAATLSGAQLIPPVATSATGTGTFTLSADGTALTYTITFSGLSSPWKSVDIHVGSAVDNTGISHQFFPGDAAGGASGTSGTVTGSFTLSSTATADEAGGLSVGGLYVVVTTTAHTGGEIRGQIVSPGDEVFVAKLTAAQDVPPQASAYTARAAFIVTGGGSSVRYHVSPDPGFAPSGVTWGTAIGGQPTVASAQTGLGAMLDGTIDISDPAPWEKGEIYISAQTSPTSPAIRGQVIRPGETLFTSTLVRSAAAPNSTVQGYAEVILDPTDTNVRYEVQSTSANVTGVFLNFGGYPGATGDAGPSDAGAPDAGASDGGSDAGSNADASGSAVRSSLQLTIAQGIATNETPDAGGGLQVVPLALTPAQVQALQSGSAWINVETTSVPAGEIQGQLLAQ